MTQGNSGAQNKLGELFVDFGTKGVGGLLKNLNTVSASFLLGKNAANQFAQTLTKPIKEAGNAAVAAGKLSTQLATSYKEAYRLQMYLKQKNTSEGLLNELAGIQKVFADMEMGTGDWGDVAKAFGFLGLNVQSYNSSLESMLQLTEDVRKATAGLDDVKSNQILRMLGLSNEWRYFWERGGNLKNSALISDAVVEENIRAAEAMAKLGTNTQAMKDYLISKIAPAVVKISDVISKFEEKFLKEEPDAKLEKAGNFVKTGGSQILSKTPFAMPLMAGAAIVGAVKKAHDGTPIPASIQGTNGVPPSSVQNSSVQITNNNNIQGTNATDIANKINNKTKESFEYSEYQVNNSPSL